MQGGYRKKLQFPTNNHLAVARKRLKIDGYILRCVLPALNPFSIHVKFTAIVPGAYPLEAKMCKKCAKMENFWTYGLNYCTGNGWRYMGNGYMLRWAWQALNPLFIHVTLTAIVPKCALGWLQKLTHVPLAIAILLVYSIIYGVNLERRYRQHVWDQLKQLPVSRSP